MFRFGAVVLGAMLVTAPAYATTVDGVLDASYGAAQTVVGYAAAAPSSNFGSPVEGSNTVGYSIYMTTDANNVYGYLEAAGTPALTFANLYFDIDSGNGITSDIVYEITNQRATVSGSTFPVPITFFQAGNVIEFSIPNLYITSPNPTGLSTIFLRESQSFGYTVVGGPSFGRDGLAQVTLGADAAVPEPASWAMMIGGFGLVGGAMRRRSVTTKVAFA